MSRARSSRRGPSRRGPSRIWAAGIALALVTIPCLGAGLVDLVLGIDPEALAAAPGLGPSWEHPLGTDDLGRDQFARLLHGGRVSLLVAALGALVAFILGAGVGLVAGWRGGATETVLMRATEAFMALPKLPLMLVLTGLDPARAVGLRPGPETEILTLVTIIGLFSWPDVARLVRAATRSLRTRAFVRAAEGLGLGPIEIARIHLLPHLAAPLGVALALDLGENLLYESALSFLGLGISPPTPSWGALLAQAFGRIADDPGMVVLPGLLTLVVVASAHAVAEDLRARSNPATARLAGRRTG